MKLIDENQVIVLSGDTGCGKSTQVPQYILDDYIKNMEGARCNIIVTQPRRVSAMALADRVAKERGEKVGIAFVIVLYKLCICMGCFQDVFLEGQGKFKFIEKLILFRALRVIRPVLLMHPFGDFSISLKILLTKGSFTLKSMPKRSYSLVTSAIW